VFLREIAAKIESGGEIKLLRDDLVIWDPGRIGGD
jgi:hypothetical protein